MTLTSVLLTREGALAAGQDPEHQVGHPEGEQDDGVTEHEGQHQHQDHGPWVHNALSRSRGEER